jgi:Spy/CpxP family protein refolding chaperone
MNRNRGFKIALWLLLLVATGWLAWAYGPMGMGYGPGHGWGRAGVRDADRFPAWYDMGSGMMRDHDGMMMGRGFGMGGDATMMARRLPDLSAEQAGRIGRLEDELARRNLDLMRQRREVLERLNRLYAAERRDWNAIRAASREAADLQRRQMEAAIDTQQKLDDVLTESQRREMARSWRNHGWMGTQ